MYVRRKVFSIANDYDNFDNSYDDFDDYFSQRLYSEAFEDGIDFAVEKMFGDKLSPASSPLAIGPAGDPGLRGNYEKSLWDKIKGLPKSIKDRYMKAGKWGKAGMIAAAAAPVLAAAGYGIHKATKKDKTYSEGFEDGVDYAIQKMFAKQALHPDEVEQLKQYEKEFLSKGIDPTTARNMALDKKMKEKAEYIGDPSIYTKFRSRMADKAAAKAGADVLASKVSTPISKEEKDATRKAANAAAEKVAGDIEFKKNLINTGHANYTAGYKAGRGELDQVQSSLNKLNDMYNTSVKNSKYYEDLYKKGEISKKELETALEAARNRSGVLEHGLKAAQDKVEGFKTAFNTEQMLHDYTKKGKEAAEKLAKRWKYGAIGAGVAGAGIGTAGILRGRRRDRD